MALKGQTQNLRNFNKKLLAMDKTVAAKVADRGAAAITQLARASYDSGRSVYGESFPNGWTLKDSGDTRKFVAYKSDGGTKIRCAINTPYAIYLIRYGVLPNSGAAMPASWQVKLKQITDEEMDKVVS